MTHRRSETVQEAIRFLCTLDLEVIGTVGGWIVRGVGLRNNGRELICDSDAELIGYARRERELLLDLCRLVGVNSPGDLPQYGSGSAVAQNRDLLLAAWLYAAGEEEHQEAKP